MSTYFGFNPFTVRFYKGIPEGQAIKEGERTVYVLDRDAIISAQPETVDAARALAEAASVPRLRDIGSLEIHLRMQYLEEALKFTLAYAESTKTGLEQISRTAQETREMIGEIFSRLEVAAKAQEDKRGPGRPKVEKTN